MKIKKIKEVSDTPVIPGAWPLLSQRGSILNKLSAITPLVHLHNCWVPLIVHLEGVTLN